MEDLEAESPPSGEQALVRDDAPAQLGDVVAEHLAEPSRLKEIPLHVDDKQGATRRRDIKSVGFRLNRKLLAGSLGFHSGRDEAQIVPSPPQRAEKTPILLRFSRPSPPDGSGVEALFLSRAPHLKQSGLGGLIANL